MTMVELLLTIGLIALSFVGIFNLFQLSISVVTGAKARAGALALAQERMEQIRSLPYDTIGTSGGIPAGSIAQSETVTLNQTTYTRRTFIGYVDDPADGSGASDQNGIVADYKKAKVEIVWSIKDRLYSFSEVTTIAPSGVESTAGGGTLRIQAIDASAAPVNDASVRIINPSASPAIDVVTYADSSGVVLFPGTPAGSGYQVIVTKPGYSSAQTYSTSGSNPNPNPGHLSIAAGQTTTQSFAIDLLASLSLRTFRGIESASWSDTFANANNLALVASTTVSGGSLTLAEGESLGSARANMQSPGYLYAWGSASFTPSIPSGATLKVHVYYDASGTATLVPDTSLPGNAAGFSSSPINLSSLSTTTYPGLALGVEFDQGSAPSAPALSDWAIAYEVGPTPLPSFPLTLRGAKTIGTTGSGSSVYKSSLPITTSGAASWATSTLEWDSYTAIIDYSATGYDLAGSCGGLPLSVSPGANAALDLYLLAHTTNSLVVTVKNSSTGATINGASVTLSRTGFSSAGTTKLCGQLFYPGLSAGTVSGGNTYTAQVSKAGYQSATQTGVVVSGASSVSISLTPL